MRRGEFSRVDSMKPAGFRVDCPFKSTERIKSVSEAEQRQRVAKARRESSHQRFQDAEHNLQRRFGAEPGQNVTEGETIGVVTFSHNPPVVSCCHSQEVVSAHVDASGALRINDTPGMSSFQTEL